MERSQEKIDNIYIIIKITYTPHSVRMHCRCSDGGLFPRRLLAGLQVRFASLNKQKLRLDFKREVYVTVQDCFLSLLTVRLLLNFDVCIISKDFGSLLAETVVRSNAVLVSVGYDLCPNGTTVATLLLHVSLRFLLRPLRNFLCMYVCVCMYVFVRMTFQYLWQRLSRWNVLTLHSRPKLWNARMVGSSDL